MCSPHGKKTDQCPRKLPRGFEEQGSYLDQKAVAGKPLFRRARLSERRSKWQLLAVCMKSHGWDGVPGIYGSLLQGSL